MPTYIVFYSGDEPVEELLYERDEMCWGARRGCTSEMCGGCVGCLALQAEHSGAKYTFIERNDVNAQSILKEIMLELLARQHFNPREGTEAVEALVDEHIDLFKERVTKELDQLDGKFAGLVFRRRDGKVEEQFVCFMPRDRFLPELLNEYVDLCSKGGAGVEQVAAVDRLNGRVRTWQAANPTKIPDAEPGECP